MGGQILQFNRGDLCIKSLVEREHRIDISIIAQIDKGKVASIDGKVFAVAKRIIQAKRRKASIILMMGAHVIRAGVQRYLIGLMERGYISCIAMNGGGMIHDFEFALIGATTESVAHYIKEGQFGLWKETGYINDIINSAYREDPSIGMGEAIGGEIEGGDFPHKDMSILCTGYKLNIPRIK
jgi:hypothetical protein